MTIEQPATWIAFAHADCLAHGTPREVATAVKAHADANPEAQLFVFDAATSLPIELDLRGSPGAVLARLPATGAGEAAAAPVAEPSVGRQPGRPRLGVVAREVTLLPRHWEWLAKQPGGASVALRKLVEDAQRGNRDADRIREARESAYRFMNAMAGNEPGFEEATRALFAGDRARLGAIAAAWPHDVYEHVGRLADAAVMVA